MIDKKGFLPAHVACSRHCSPEKLGMLLQVNPTSLFAKTHDGKMLLDLAKQTATKSHPNYTLINDIQRRITFAAAPTSAAMYQYHVESGRVSSTDDSDQGTTSSTVHNRAPIARNHQLKRKRKVTADDEEIQNAIKQEDVEPANLLLHFSRNMDDERARNIASV